MIFIDFWDTKGLWIAPKRSGSTTSSPLRPFCPSQPLGKHTGHTASSEPSLEASYPQGFWDSQHIRSTSVSVSPIPSSSPTHPWTSCASQITFRFWLWVGAKKSPTSINQVGKVASTSQPFEKNIFVQIGIIFPGNLASRVAAPAIDDGFFRIPRWRK